MKDMNMNAVRMSHYPPDQHFLDVCDSLGMFVLDELTGWQAYYSTEVGTRLVKELVERDVNHPSILLWDNGNEGGFNKELRGEYAKYDPQNRQVIEPWTKLNGMDTPNIAVSDSGYLKMTLPKNWKDYDVLYFTATDPYGRLINTWSWNISSPEALKYRLVKSKKDEVKFGETADFIFCESGIIRAQFSKKSGLLTEVKVGDKLVPFNNGPTFVGDTLTFKEIKLLKSGNQARVEIAYDKSPQCFARWTMFPGGWLELEYQYHPVGKTDFAGITFSYPENLVRSATLIANGPYHVWKNRLKGNEFGVFNKNYNNTVTGETWDYPEFKGYHSNFYAVQVRTKELPFTLVSATPDLFLHLFTPQTARISKGGVSPAFPSGNISLLNGISAIGTKFTKPEAEGPQSQRNEYLKEAKPLTGKIYFHFRE